MYYQLLIYQEFLTPEIYSVGMEHDKSLVLLSPAYLENKTLIDEYLSLEGTIGGIIESNTKVTKLVSPDGNNQVIQIECEEAVSRLFLDHPSHDRFEELRLAVALGILHCVYTDESTYSGMPSTTYSTYEEARANFHA